MKKTLGDYIVIIISVIGSVLSIFGFVTIFQPLLNEQGWIGVAFLGVIALFFLGYNLYLISKYRTRTRYAEAFEDINIGFAELHKIQRDEIDDIQEIVKKIISLCNSVSGVFTKIYGHHIGVCVKMISIKNERAFSETLARDKKSSAKNRRTGTKDKSKDEDEHWLDMNSDFSYLYLNYDDDNKDTSFYHKTKLPIREDYLNTRLRDWPPKKVRLFNSIVRRKLWPLKYKSTLVVPIVPLLADDQNQKALRGFLCVDSPKENCFNIQFDVDILKGISDGLYNTIDELQKTTQNE